MSTKSNLFGVTEAEIFLHGLSPLSLSLSRPYCILLHTTFILVLVDLSLTYFRIKLSISNANSLIRNLCCGCWKLEPL